MMCMVDVKDLSALCSNGFRGNTIYANILDIGRYGGCPELTNIFPYLHMRQI